MWNSESQDVAQADEHLKQKQRDTPPSTFHLSYYQNASDTLVRPKHAEEITSPSWSQLREDKLVEMEQTGRCCLKSYPNDLDLDKSIDL